MVVTTTEDATGSLLGTGVLFAVYVAVLALMIISMWKIFEKAGEEG